MKMTRKAKIAGGAFSLIVTTVVLAWMCGYMPFTQRSQVRHALGIKCLPFSVDINQVGGESWTDYLFFADISVDPDDVDYLLQGRSFEKAEYLGEIPQSYLDNYEGFNHDSRYDWGDWQEIGAICILTDQRVGSL